MSRRGHPQRKPWAQLWSDIWTLATRANVAFQLLGGALLVMLVDLAFRVRARFGYAL